MKNLRTLIAGLALTLAAGTCNSESLEHTFSTDDLIFIDPLLAGLTSVSGSFTYDNGVNLSGTVGEGFPSTGSTIYPAVSNLSGDADGNIFSDPEGLVISGNDEFSNFSPPTDIVTVNWEQGAAGSLNGFNFAGMPLVNVRLFWIEGLEGIGDFLDDPALPAALPPTISGRLDLVFVDGAGGFHRAIWGVTVVPLLPDNSDITFSGQLEVIETDIGGRVYSGVPLGTRFFGAINRFTSDGFISDGTITTEFDCCVDESLPGLSVENDAVLEEGDGELLAALGVPGFVDGDTVDIFEIGGAAITADGSRISVELIYVLDSLAFDDDSRDNYPPDPADLLATLFLIVEDEERGLTISFDTFDNLGEDAIAIDVFVDGELVARNLTNPFTDGSLVPVSVNFDADGTLDLTFDGSPIFVDLPSGFEPQTSDRLGFGGRTGAGNQVNRIDNVSISVCGDAFGCPPPDAVYVNDFSAGVGPASLLGAAVLESGSVRLTDSINFQLGSLVIDDLVPGGAIASFSGTFDLQMGPGSVPPADGVSFYLGPLPDSAFGEQGAEENEVYVAFGTVPPDSDGDGIADVIDGIVDGVFSDQSSVVSNDFTDQHLGGTTRGTIVDRSDNEVTVTDDPFSGVMLAANGGTGTSRVQMCGPSNIDIFNVLLTDGDQFGVTCGSLTGEVLAGPVAVTVGVSINITIPAGAKAFMEQLPGSLVSVTNLSATGGPDIVVEEDGVPTAVGPGDPPLVTAVDDGLPDAPDDVAGRAKRGKVSLTWTPVDEVESYEVYRALQSGGPYALVGSVAGNVFIDTNVVTGETYYYVVQSVAGGNNSANSNEAEVLVPAGRRRR